MNLSLTVWEGQDWRWGSETIRPAFLEGPPQHERLGRGEAVRSMVLGMFSGEN